MVSVVDTSLHKIYTTSEPCLIRITFLVPLGQGRGEWLVDDAIESRKVEGGDNGLTGWSKRDEREPRGFVFATGV